MECVVEEHRGAAPAEDGADGGALRLSHPDNQARHRAETQESRRTRNKNIKFIAVCDVY